MRSFLLPSIEIDSKLFFYPDTLEPVEKPDGSFAFNFSSKDIELISFYIKGTRDENKKIYWDTFKTDETCDDYDNSIEVKILFEDEEFFYQIGDNPLDKINLYTKFLNIERKNIENTKITIPKAFSYKERIDDTILISLELYIYVFEAESEEDPNINSIHVGSNIVVGLNPVKTIKYTLTLTDKHPHLKKELIGLQPT